MVPMISTMPQAGLQDTWVTSPGVILTVCHGPSYAIMLVVGIFIEFYSQIVGAGRQFIDGDSGLKAFWDPELFHNIGRGIGAENEFAFDEPVMCKLP